MDAGGWRPRSSTRRERNGPVARRGPRQEPSMTAESNTPALRDGQRAAGLPDDRAGEPHVRPALLLRGGAGPADGGVPRGQRVLEAAGGGPRPSSSTSATPAPARWCRSASSWGCSTTRAALPTARSSGSATWPTTSGSRCTWAITTEDEAGPAPMPLEKVRVLNALFNERLTRPGKKVLILPDLFGPPQGNHLRTDRDRLRPHVHGMRSAR